MTKLCPFRLPITFYNVKDYGATGNGTTEDTTAILNTIAAAPAGQGVYFPPGTYRCDHIHIQKQLTIIGGAPTGGVWPSKVKLIDSPTGTTQLWRVDGAPSGLTIRNLEFDLNGKSYNGIASFGGTYNLVENCYFHGNNVVSGLPVALTFDSGSNYSIVRDCKFDDCHEAIGVMKSSYCQVLNNTCTNLNRLDGSGPVDEGIFIGGILDSESETQYNILSGNSVTDSCSPAYYVYFALNNTVQSNTSTNCKGGIYVHNSTNNGVNSGNLIDNNTFTGGANAQEYGIFCANKAASNTFSNNHVTNYTTATYAISIPSSAGTGNIFSGNHVTNSKQVRIGKAITFSGNTVETATGTGVYWDTASTGVVFTNNEIKTCQYSGVNFAAAMTNTTFTGNTCKNNGQRATNADFGLQISAGGGSGWVITGNTFSDDQGTHTQYRGVNVTATNTGGTASSNTSGTGAGNIAADIWDGIS